MLYEIGYLKDGSIVHGGMKATLTTVGKWIEEAVRSDPETVYVAVPADNEAVTIAECRMLVANLKLES